MAVPVKPQSKRSRPASVILANPDAAHEPFVSATATFADALPLPADTVSPPLIDVASVVVAPTPAADVPQPISDYPERSEETVAAHSEATVSVFSKGLPPMATAFDTTKAHDMMGDISTRAKGAMEKSVKFAEEMTEFTKGNVEAIVASSRVAVKGIESMAQDAAETAKSGFEQAQTAMKSFTQVKSPTELFQLQSDFAKTAFDQMVANASKASEQVMKLMGDVAQPLSNRYALASEKVKSATL
ncbi:MAG TPA: phasin family protein [Sphingomonas sp.]|uniref:phasin family protein n=1 Tax=Sphingomonas sp. TaxID=28214 RepID=UPI002EDB0249